MSVKRGDRCQSSGFLVRGECRNPDGCVCRDLTAKDEALSKANDLLRRLVAIREYNHDWDGNARRDYDTVAEDARSFMEGKKP